MRPSTVQTSRFSFFSRDVILAFTPCSTASTCAIESFQRKPNGGDNSSTEYACAIERIRAMPLVERIRRIAPPLRLRGQLGCHFFVFVCVARMSIASQWHSGGGKIACMGQFGQIRSGVAAMQPDRSLRLCGCARLRKKSAKKLAVGYFSWFPSDTCFSFSSQENFLFATKNKIHFFLVGFQSDF